MIHTYSQPQGAEIPYTHEKRGHEDKTVNLYLESEHIRIVNLTFIIKVSDK